MAARVYDEVFGYIEDATKTLPGAAAPGELVVLSVEYSSSKKKKKALFGVRAALQESVKLYNRKC